MSDLSSCEPLHGVVPDGHVTHPKNKSWPPNSGNRKADSPSHDPYITTPDSTANIPPRRDEKKKRRYMNARYLGNREDGGRRTCDLTLPGSYRESTTTSGSLERLGFWAPELTLHCATVLASLRSALYCSRFFVSRKSEKIRGFSIAEPLRTPGLGFWGPSSGALLLGSDR